MKRLRRPMITALTATSAIGGIAMMLAVLMTPSFAAMLGPIATSGHDQDIIVELGATVGTQVTNGELGSRHFYENGLQASQATNPKQGITQNITGIVSTITGNTIDFQFNPFIENNILKFDVNNTGTKTLSLATPTGYRNLAVVFSGGSLSSTVASLNYTIHYAGGGIQTGSIGAPDWGNVALPAGTEMLVNAGRINMGTTGIWNNQVPEGDTTANRWSVYMSEITTISNLDILSIDFSAAVGTADLSASQDVVVFGLAGTLVPEPSMMAIALGAVAITLLRRGKAAPTLTHGNC